MKQLKLEVGKTYLNREGKRVKIVENTGHKQFPFDGDNYHSYTLDGRYWYDWKDSALDLIAEADAPIAQPEKRTFKIPENTREISVSETDGRIIIEFVPEDPEFKEGDIVFEDGRVMIVKSYPNHYYANTYPKTGRLSIDDEYGLPFTTPTFRPATTAEEAQPLWDALKKAGKRWNPEEMQVEDVPEIYRIREWVEMHLEDGHYNQEGIAEVIGHYLKHREGEK